MSKDKHKGVARRKFALAQLPIKHDGSPQIKVRGYALPVRAKDASLHPMYRTQRPLVDITYEIKQLKKAGKLKTVRVPRGFGTKNTVITPRRPLTPSEHSNFSGY
jgi:hypothetical protein